MLKSFIKAITPPVLLNGMRLVRDRMTGRGVRDRSKLFDGQDSMFVAAMRDVRSYGEYGMGLSTLWVDENTDAMIHSVDTSSSWVDVTKKRLRRDGHDLTHIDVGPIGNWGYPDGYSHRDEFANYAEAIWKNGTQHNLVLIDGRFRVACFLTSMMRAKPGCTIIFDDYVGRPHYHVIEEVLAPEEKNMRQARFVVPDQRDFDALAALRDQFLLVRE